MNAKIHLRPHLMYILWQLLLSDPFLGQIDLSNNANNVGYEVMLSRKEITVIATMLCAYEY